ncbi:hypothetical protein SK128_010348 [Halocaridina rubra]|uniref:UV radiation resistance-associated gene protein n=1 Tax=Halocaridina rubra TaxID=373956 RepID=A0AAN8ZT35_HALRR
METKKSHYVEEPRFTSQEQVVQLWSYQHGLRLRHLSQIVGRNLRNGSHPEPTPASPLPSKFPRPPASMGYYFTLHSPSHKEILYSSEMQSTCNPNWLEMHPEDIKPIHLRSLKGVLIRLWFKPEKGDAQIITTWGIHFSGLIPVGSVMPYNYEKYECNTLVLKLRNYFYTAPGSYIPSGEEKPFPLYYGYSLPLSESKRSYTVNSLSRLHSTKRAQRQQEIRCQETHSVLEHQGITRTSRKSQLATEVEDCRVKVALLREQLQAEIDQLRALKLSADNMDNQNQEKVLELLGGYQDLNRQLKQFRSLQGAALSEGDKLKFACGCLRDWRVQLISQLPHIYPVTQEMNNKYRVCGVHLPDAEKYDNCTDTALSVGLGYVAHILYILAQFLNVPLRYPISPYGSQATITDSTSLQLRDTEREFPLFSRGKEKEKLHFNYGVFLLNKNIAQMRWYCGILTQDLRPTLSNLSVLMSRLIQESVSPSVAVMPDVLVPPLVSRDYVGYEGRTPATLLQQKRSPQISEDTVGHGLSLEPQRTESEEHEDPQWKTARSSSDTDSPSELSPSKLSLYVREVSPLHGKENSGKFVFVDHVRHDLVDPSLAEQKLEERLSHANGFSFSLDNGLNHIGGKNLPYYKIKDLSSCDDLNINKVSKLMNLPRGSDPSLLAKMDVGVQEEGEVLPVFKEQTTELLRSWTEDAPSHYLGVAEVSSSEKLEEVGVECKEETVISPAGEAENIPLEPEIKTVAKNATSVASSLNESDKDQDNKNTEGDVSPAAEAKDLTETLIETGKSEKELDNASLFLSQMGVTEDMFLNDVAFRTAALASQSCSFKMSFSRQSTEDEYH